MSSAEELLSYLIREGCLTPTDLLKTKVGEVFSVDEGDLGGLVVAKVMLYQAAYTLLLDEELSNPPVKHGLLVVAREFSAIQSGGLMLRERPSISKVTIFTNQRPAELWRGQNDKRPLFATLDVAEPIVRV